MKECHPDLSGDDPETTNFCMFINEVYEVSSLAVVYFRYCKIPSTPVQVLKLKIDFLFRFSVILCNEECMTKFMDML